jgi:hypothetical protein
MGEQISNTIDTSPEKLFNSSGLLLSATLTFFKLKK